MIYDLAAYIRANVTFPGDFDPADQFVVGGWLPDDKLVCVLLRESSGLATGDMQDRRDLPFQFLARGETHGEARDLIFAIFDSPALGTTQPDGGFMHARFQWPLSTSVWVSKFSWIQTPYDLGATEPGGYAYSANCLIVTGNSA